jgi:DNA-binding cell septation regulator SpoVG
MAHNEEIKVLELRFMNGDKALKAFADIQVNGWVIREFRLIKENGKRLWVAPPQLSWKAPDGHIQYKTIITFPDDVKGEIDRVILNRFTEELEKESGKTDHQHLQG